MELVPLQRWPGFTGEGPSPNSQPSSFLITDLGPFNGGVSPVEIASSLSCSADNVMAMDAVLLEAFGLPWRCWEKLA